MTRDIPVLRFTMLLISSSFLVACAKTGSVIANLPVKWSGNEIVRNIAYGGNSSQRLDIYIPEEAKARQPLPVIVFFYGGRWTSGEKGMYAFVGDRFANKNYVTVIADYQKYPDVEFPVFVEDAARAVAWTYKNIARYAGDPNKIYIAGHSSGAHIAALITADERYLNAEGQSTAIIKAFAGLAGPYDFIPQEQDLKDLFGPPENYPQMQVTHFIDGNEPPMLLLWGADDTIVVKRNIDLLEKGIKQKGGVVNTNIYADMGHIDIVSSFTWFANKEPPVAEDITTFFERFQ